MKLKRVNLHKVATKDSSCCSLITWTRKFCAV